MKSLTRLGSTDLIHRGLRYRWISLWQKLGIQGPPVVDQLLQRWQESRRFYHTVEHLSYCLSLYDRCPYRDPLVEVALWFHDAVYDPRSSENEAQSAELGRQVMEDAGLSAASQDIVVRCILATRHRDPPRDAAEALTLDVDLGILGSGRRRYQRFERGIRREYAWVQLEDYRRERGRILQRFLALPRLYHHAWFHRRLNSRASSNLRWSLRSLETLHG